MELGGLFADILVVDGEPDVVRSVRPVLQSAGYIMRGVSRGAAALDAVQIAEPDLILLGTELPDMEGHEAARRLKYEATSFVPIIMMASAGHEDVAAAMNAGADEFISKPLDNTELLIRVRAMLRMKQNLDELAEFKASLERKVRDRTRELKEIHEKLQHTEKLSAMGRFSASIAHEITNPLNVILTQLHLWRRQGELPDDLSMPDPVDVIEHHVEMIVGLMDQLRSFSRPPRKGRQSVNLNDVVESVLALTAKELQMHRIEVDLDLDPALPSVQASENQLEEVFMNLILNARDAMPEGGELTICTEADDAWVYARVRDTGTGIDPDLQARVFEPFFTTKGEEGTGLGLAISHSIVAEHDGEIVLESRVGHGTTFKLCLPT